MAILVEPGGVVLKDGGVFTDADGSDCCCLPEVDCTVHQCVNFSDDLSWALSGNLRVTDCAGETCDAAFSASGLITRTSSNSCLYTCDGNVFPPPICPNCGYVAGICEVDDNGPNCGDTTRFVAVTGVDKISMTCGTFIDEDGAQQSGLVFSLLVYSREGETSGDVASCQLYCNSSFGAQGGGRDVIFGAPSSQLSGPWIRALSAPSSPPVECNPQGVIVNASLSVS